MEKETAEEEGTFLNMGLSTYNAIFFVVIVHYPKCGEKNEREKGGALKLRRATLWC